MKKLVLTFSMMACIALTTHAQFTVPALSYSTDALEPHIDKETMEIHHDKHHAAYVNKLNDEVAKNAALKGKTIEEIVKQVSKYNKSVRDNAGGHYNHSLFWTVIGPDGHTFGRYKCNLRFI
jgi:Fe-Mn family superoxide dismutase